MQKSIQISIPQPCNVPWDSMTKIDEQKRHCSSCERVIVDFTKMTDAELVSYFRKEKKLCGRFGIHQLNRKIAVEENKTRKYWPMAFLLPPLFLAMEANAQDEGKVSEQNQFILNKNQPDSVVVAEEVAATDTIFIEGKITDSADSLPLIGAVIYYQNETGTHYCTADLDGNYRLALPGLVEGDTITIHVKYLGATSYEEKISVGTASVERNIILNVSEFTSVIGYLETPSLRNRIRSFFYRLFHPRYW